MQWPGPSFSVLPKAPISIHETPYGPHEWRQLHGVTYAGDDYVVALALLPVTVFWFDEVKNGGIRAGSKLATNNLPIFAVWPIDVLTSIKAIQACLAFDRASCRAVVFHSVVNITLAPAHTRILVVPDFHAERDKEKSGFAHCLS